MHNYSFLVLLLSLISYEQSSQICRMTLSRPRKRRTQTSSSSGRENSAASENRAVDPDGVEEAVEIHLRGCHNFHLLFPMRKIVHWFGQKGKREFIIPQPDTLLTCLNCILLFWFWRHWREIPRLGKERRPASVLTCLLKTYHPGIVQFRGMSVVATTWKHYKVDRDTSGRSKATDVEEGFWVIKNVVLFASTTINSFYFPP